MACQALMACHLKIVGILGGMAKSPKLGPTGETVRVNVRRLRDARGISAAELSKKLDALGRPIPLVGIQRIEAGERRPDTDDLVALAAALGVSPLTLLMPASSSPRDQVELLDRQVSARAMLDWLRARRGSIPQFTGSHFEFLSRSLPAWAVEELERDMLEVVARDRERLEGWLSEDDDGDDQ